jgi:hypothetical protein
MMVAKSTKIDQFEQAYRLKKRPKSETKGHLYASPHHVSAKIYELCNISPFFLSSTGTLINFLYLCSCFEIRSMYIYGLKTLSVLPIPIRDH